MNHVIRDFTGIIGAFVAWWALVVLTACLSGPLIVEGEAPTPVDTAVLLPPIVAATPTLVVTATAVPTAVTSSTMPPAATPTPMPPSPTPLPADPRLITQGETAVHIGPGLEYELSHFLGPGTTAPILGRNVAGDWWAIHGPGDGPGPHSWVAAADVIVEGHTGHLPILPAPILPPTPVGAHDVPLVGETGSPPSERCIISHPGLTGPVNVHLGPGAQFALIARLDVNRWAEGIQEQVNWYEIRLGPGQVGWILVTAVALNEFC